eukprot:762568-Hanusia_phi.AAC.2
MLTISGSYRIVATMLGVILQGGALELLVIPSTNPEDLKFISQTNQIFTRFNQQTSMSVSVEDVFGNSLENYASSNVNRAQGIIWKDSKQLYNDSLQLDQCPNLCIVLKFRFECDNCTMNILFYHSSVTSSLSKPIGIFVSEEPEPQMLTAQFDSSLTSILVTMSGETFFNAQESCANLLGNNFMNLLGAQPSCFSTDNQHIKILLGNNASVAFYDQIKFLPGSLKTRAGRLMGEKFALLIPPSQLENFNIEIDCPDILGLGSDLLLNVRFRQGQTTRGLSLDWGLKEGPNSDSIRQILRESMNKHTVNISGNLFEYGYTYEFSLRARIWTGQTCITTKQVSFIKLYIPSLFIAGGPVISIPIYGDITIKAVLSLPSAVPDKVTIMWSQLDGTTLNSLQSDYFGTELLLKQSQLVPKSTMLLKVSVYSKEGNKARIQNVSQSVTIYFTPAPVSNKFLRSVIFVEAMQSFYLYTKQFLSLRMTENAIYIWSCSSSTFDSCFDSGSGIAVQLQSNSIPFLLVPANSLLPGNYTFKVEVYIESVSRTASLLYDVVVKGTQVVNLDLSSTIVMFPDSLGWLSLVGKVDSATNLDPQNVTLAMQVYSENTFQSKVTKGLTLPWRLEPFPGSFLSRGMMAVKLSAVSANLEGLAKVDLVFRPPLGGSLQVQEILFVRDVLSVYQINFVGFQAQAEDYPLVYSLYQGINNSANGLLYVDSGINANFKIYHSTVISGVMNVTGFASSVFGESVGYHVGIGSSTGNKGDIVRDIAQLQAAYEVLFALMEDVSRTADSKALKQIALLSVQAAQKYIQADHARGIPKASLQLDATDSSMEPSTLRSASMHGGSLSPALLTELEGVSEDFTNVFAEAILAMFTWQGFDLGLNGAISRLVNLLKRVEDIASDEGNLIAAPSIRVDHDLHTRQLSPSSAPQDLTQFTVLATDALLLSWNYSTLSKEDVGSFSQLYGMILNNLLVSTDENLKLSIANNFLTFCTSFVSLVDTNVPWPVYISFVDDVGKLCIIEAGSSGLSTAVLKIIQFANQIIRGSLNMIVDDEEARLIETSFASVWAIRTSAYNLLSHDVLLCMSGNECVQTVVNDAFLPEPAVAAAGNGTLNVQIILWKTLPNAYGAALKDVVALGPILQLNASDSSTQLNYMTRYRKLRDYLSITFDVQTSTTALPRCAWITENLGALNMQGFVADSTVAGKLACWSYARMSRLGVVYFDPHAGSAKDEFYSITTESFQGAYANTSDVASAISLLILISTSIFSFIHLMRVIRFVHQVVNRYLGFKTSNSHSKNRALPSPESESLDNVFSLRRFFLHHPFTTLLYFSYQSFPVYLHRVFVLSASINFLFATNYMMQVMRVFVEKDWAAQATVTSILVIPVYLLLLFPIFAQKGFEQIMFRRKGRVFPEEVPDIQDEQASATKTQPQPKSSRHSRSRRSRKAKGRRSRRIDEELESAMGVMSQTSGITSAMSLESPRGTLERSAEESQRHPFSPSTLRVSMVNWSVNSPHSSGIASAGSQGMGSRVSRASREGVAMRSQTLQTEIQEEEEEEDLEGIMFRGSESGITLPVIGRHFGLPYEELVVPPVPPSSPRLQHIQHQVHDEYNPDVFMQSVIARLENLNSSREHADPDFHLPEEFWHASSPVQSDVTLPQQLSFEGREQRSPLPETSQTLPLDVSQLQTEHDMVREKPSKEPRRGVWGMILFALRWVLLNPLLFCLSLVDASGAFVLRTSPSINVILFNVLLWYIVDQLSFSFDPSYNQAWRKAITLSIVLWIILHAVLLLGAWAVRVRIMRI